jgi:hypothetical protein
MMTANIHHVVVTWAGIYTLFFMPPQTPIMALLISPTKENLTYYPLNSQMMMFIIAYMVFDFLVQMFIVKNNTPLGKQYYVHHVVVCFIAILALLMGMAMPKLFQLSMLCELSTLFINLRDIIGKKEWKGFLANVNAVCFIVTFTLIRVLMFTILIYSHFKLA